MSFRQVSWWVAGICSLLPFGACGAGDGKVWRGTVSDSAGITVVANPADGLWEDGGGWQVREDLVIGQVEGDPDHLFGSIAGICVSAAGDIVVVDQQVRSVRVFDPEGGLLRVFGGPGSGPGELGNTLVGCYITPGDTVAVPDLQLYRVSRLLLDGTVIGAVPFDIGAGVPIRWTMRSDGRLVTQMRFGLLDPSLPGISDALVAEGAQGALEERLFDLPVSEAIARPSGRPRYTLLAPRPIWTLARDGSVWVYGGGSYRLTRYDADGVPTMVVHRAVEAQMVSETDRTVLTQWIERTFAAPLIASVMGGVNFAPTFPFVFALAIGPEGTLWAQRFRPPSALPEAIRESFNVGPENPEVFLADPTLRLGAPDWDVFDADGRYLGVVTLPEGFEAVALTGDAIYGIWRDAMEVEYVKRLRVVRPGVG